MQMDRRLQSPTDARIDLELGFYRCNTAFIAALDVKTAFDVAKPSVVHGHLTAVLSAEMRDVGRCFEKSETEFRDSRCIRQGGVEAPVLWGRVAKCVLWKAEENWKTKGWGSPFGGQHGSEYVLRGMSWADNYWLFCDQREIDMHGDRHHRRVVGSGHGAHRNRCAGLALRNMRMWQHFKREADGRPGTSLFVRSLGFWDIVITRMGKGSQGAERTVRKGLGSWWRDRFIYRSKTVPC